MTPKKFHQRTESEFYVEWDDGHQGPIRNVTLRDHCPCAGCNGERVLFTAYVPPPADRTAPGRFTVKGIEVVGNYALKITWGDGHDLGIYPWALLRSLCDCPECSKNRSQH